MAIMTTYLPRSDNWNMSSAHCAVDMNDPNTLQYSDENPDEPTQIIITQGGQPTIFRFDGAYVHTTDLAPDAGYWIRTNPSAPGFFTYECPDIDGGGTAYIFPSLWVRGDGDETHIPPWRVNYISYTFPVPFSMNSLFPGSWYDSDPDVGEASSGVLTNQDVIYTDFWNYTVGGEIVENKPSSYYDGTEWIPDIILQPGRGYVLKTRLNGYVKWTLN
jgi:hypothetical protein